ncbi:MAG: hypothetical protein COV47_04855 [Candidatus Diapherotrites archaeon CG11_big_fil_rev_8_21_14_0_20_37_9]|nr:MAG: hypothetical protein COV47_04855 [Candidatus Diapherotrites archaeon CG11_big_fil_rev_8_21_14_0_20_37_9]
MGIWIDAVLKPKETFATEAPHGTIMKGAVNLGLVGLILGVIFAVLIILGGVLNGDLISSAFTAILIIILFPMLLIISELISTAVPFVIAKLLGGSGSYSSLFYLISIYTPIILIISMIPLAGMVAGLYSIYLFYLALKESQKLSSKKAIIIVLFPLLLIAIIMVLAFVTLLAI